MGTKAAENTYRQQERLETVTGNKSGWKQSQKTKRLLKPYKPGSERHLEETGAAGTGLGALKGTRAAGTGAALSELEQQDRACIAIGRQLRRRGGLRRMRRRHICACALLPRARMRSRVGSGSRTKEIMSAACKNHKQKQCLHM